MVAEGGREGWNTVDDSKEGGQWRGGQWRGSGRRVGA